MSELKKTKNKKKHAYIHTVEKQPKFKESFCKTYRKLKESLKTTLLYRSKPYKKGSVSQDFQYFVYEPFIFRGPIKAIINSRQAGHRHAGASLTMLLTTSANPGCVRKSDASERLLWGARAELQTRLGEMGGGRLIQWMKSYLWRGRRKRRQVGRALCLSEPQ